MASGGRGAAELKGAADRGEGHSPARIHILEDSEECWMAGRRRRNKVVSMRRKRPINIDLVFFGAVALYICVICYMAMNTEHTGLALREERVFSAETSGYVSYYAREGERVSGSSLVYTIDEKGEINALIRQNAENVDLTDENFSVIRSSIRSYMSDYSDLEFSKVYDFETSLAGSVMDLMNQNMLESLEDAGEDSMFSRIYAANIGIQEYYTDGIEEVTLYGVTEEMLEKRAGTGRGTDVQAGCFGKMESPGSAGRGGGGRLSAGGAEVHGGGIYQRSHEGLGRFFHSVCGSDSLRQAGFQQFHGPFCRSALRGGGISDH